MTAVLFLECDGCRASYRQVDAEVLSIDALRDSDRELHDGSKWGLRDVCQTCLEDLRAGREPGAGFGFPMVDVDDVEGGR